MNKEEINRCIIEFNNMSNKIFTFKLVSEVDKRQVKKIKQNYI